MTPSVVWMGNEGVVVDTPAGAYAIDALFGEGARGFGQPDAALRRRIETAASPFDRVDVFLATHHHPDHFDPDAVRRRLRAGPAAVVVTTDQAAARLAAASKNATAAQATGDATAAQATGDATAAQATAADATIADPLAADADVAEAASPDAPAGHDADAACVRVLRAGEGTTETLRVGTRVITGFGLSHGRVHYGDVRNMALIVDDGTLRTLHLGDGIIHEATLRRAGVLDVQIDVAFLPFWYLTYPFGRRLMRDRFRPRAVMALHAPDDRRAGIVDAVRQTRPDAVVPVEPGQRFRLDPEGRLVPDGRVDA